MTSVLIRQRRGLGGCCHKPGTARGRQSLEGGRQEPPGESLGGEQGPADTSVHSEDTFLLFEAASFVVAAGQSEDTSALPGLFRTPREPCVHFGAARTAGTRTRLSPACLS